MDSRYHSLLFVIILIQLMKFAKSQNFGTVRLSRNGLTSNTYSSGRVQIFFNDLWGNICGDNLFEIAAANVICHQLGYNGAITFGKNSVDSFGMDSYPILIDDVRCSTSSFLVILQCQHSFVVDQNCVNGRDDVSVHCIASRIWDGAYNGQIRLTNGQYTSEGLVELYCNGQWGTVCDDSFNQVEANTVCQQLGYTQAAKFNSRIFFNRLEVSTPIWLTRVSCLPTSICLQSCKRCPLSPVTNCIHSEDIEIKCEFINGSSVNTSLTSCGIRVITISATTHDISATPFTSENDQLSPFVMGLLIGEGAMAAVCIIPQIVCCCMCICAIRTAKRAAKNRQVPALKYNTTNNNQSLSSIQIQPPCQQQLQPPCQQQLQSPCQLLQPSCQQQLQPPCQQQLQPPAGTVISLQTTRPTLFSQKMTVEPALVKQALTQHNSNGQQSWDINITAARENINSADQIVLPKPFTHHSRQPIKVTSNAAYGVTNAVHIEEHEDLHCGNEYDYI